MNVCSVVLILLIFLPLPLWLIVLHAYDYYKEYLSSLVFGDDGELVYDFIIGSAGAVLANRLSKHNTVLLLEAGGDPTALHSVPGFAFHMLHQPQYDWTYKTVPQKNLKGYPDQVMPYPRGKVLGGSSVLNFMLYVRGNPLDYDNWANILGDESWRYEQLLPYFKKSWDYHGDFQLDKSRKYRPLEDHLARGMKELGYDEIDANGPQRSGFATFERSQKDGARFDTYNAFLRPVETNQNLRISKFSFATKILFDGHKRAVGVVYEQYGVKKIAKAFKEVILSAGSIDSPKLLMLSGIGPAEHLKSVKVKPLVDLPVGENLHDHIMTGLPNLFINESLTYNPERDFGLHEIYNYRVNGEGFLTSPVVLTHQAFLSSSKVKETGRDWPDIQLYFSGCSHYYLIPITLSEGTGIEKKYFESVFESVAGENTFGGLSGIVRPKSRGTVRLLDRNPKSPPLIDPNFYDHPDDIRAVYEGVQVILKLLNTETFQSLNASLKAKAVLGCEDYKYLSYEYWECYIKTMSQTIYHPVGTCRMGKPSDPSAVVDPQLRVLGSRGLRVVDASVMPVIPNGNTHAPTVMVAEKAADMIREFWAQQYLVCFKPGDYFRREESICSYSKTV